MGLKKITEFLQNSHDLVKPHRLRGGKLIVDGSSITGRIYEQSTQNWVTARDYDQIATIATKVFKDLQECDIECLVLFDGGHNNLSINKKLDRLDKKIQKARKEIQGKDSTPPILLEKVVTEVLDVLQIWYVFCGTEEADETISALASHYQCPILSADSDYYLCGCNFIHYSSLSRANGDNFINCKIFSRNLFASKFGIADEMLPMLYLILQNVHFPYMYFNKFLQRNHINTRTLIKSLLLWLRNKTSKSVEAAIFSSIPVKDINKCKEIIQDAERFIFARETNTFTLKFVVELGANPENVKVTKEDQQFFEKGIAMRRIPKPYIDLYKRKLFLVYVQVEDFESEDSFLPCLHILRYAFDLLTEFSGEVFKYVGRSDRRDINTDFSIKKPTGRVSFRSGWDSSADYFDHFIRETLPGLPSTAMNNVPENCKLWLLALVWWKTHAAPDAIAEGLCLLLCFTGSYGNDGDAEDDPNAKMPHAFAKFQNVFFQLSCLNQLCGRYEPISCCKAYCDSKARGALAAMKASGAKPGAFIAERLRGTPEVQDLYTRLSRLLSYKGSIKALSAGGNSK